MKKEAKETLKLFQCDYNRMLEEAFAQTLSEHDFVRLFFINENQAFTDGRNIIVDPAADELFADVAALKSTSEYLKWPRSVLSDMWNALRIITRAQTIHECLHILYTDFPCRAATDPKCSAEIKRKVMSLILNIIEDAYIEAVGCSVYDNMEFYLRFGRISRLFAAHASEGTVARMLKDDTGILGEKSEEQIKAENLLCYLNYMCVFLLYPMIEREQPNDAIKEYVDKTKLLFLEGSKASAPAERYAYASSIFDIILPLIPETNQYFDDERLKERISGTRTHNADPGTIGSKPHSGKVQEVTVRLFTDLNGNTREDAQSRNKILEAIREFTREKDAALKIIFYTGSKQIYRGADYDCAVIHRRIKINEIRPKINLNLRKAYQNIYTKYRINIDSYSNRFLQLLKARVKTREEKLQYGAGITSTRLGDLKKRFWYKNIDNMDVPDMAVLLLIDGSGSMYGERCRSAMSSAVILHEVLKKQGIQHAVVEHRAHFEDPEIDVNILVGFDARNEEKYNLMQIKADGDNRDGLALYWAERYIVQKTSAENKWIIVLSDGVPAHEYDEYYPPVSIKDTANAVKKIMKRGTNIIAVSLDDEGDYKCYDQLKEIYPQLIGCNDLKRLTGQLLGIIARLL